MLSDACYDSKVNRQVAKAIGAIPVIAKNPRKRGKTNPKTKTKPIMHTLHSIITICLVLRVLNSIFLAHCLYGSLGYLGCINNHLLTGNWRLAYG